MYFFLRKHTYFHGSDILLDLKVMLCTKLQALVYDILPLEEGAGKRCSECGYALDFHNWVDFQRSIANENCLYRPFKRRRNRRIDAEIKEKG